MIDYSILFWIKFFIIGISMAELAIQIATSDLSDMIKGAMLLQQPYNKKLQTLSLIPFWRKLLGKRLWVIATPFIFLIKIHKFFSEMLSCPYCQSFHYAWLVNWLYLDMDIITSIILAPIVLVFVASLDKLHTYGK